MDTTSNKQWFSTGRRPRIEDVLKPQTQIIVNTDCSTLPRSHRMFPTAASPQTGPQLMVGIKRANNAAAHVQTSVNGKATEKVETPTAYKTFERSQSQEENHPTEQTSFVVSTLRRSGLRKMLAAEEREKAKALNTAKTTDHSCNGKASGVNDSLKQPEQKIISKASSASNNINGKETLLAINGSGETSLTKTLQNGDSKSEDELEKTANPTNAMAHSEIIVDKEPLQNASTNTELAPPPTTTGETLANGNTKADEEIQKALNTIIAAAAKTSGTTETLTTGDVTQNASITNLALAQTTTQNSKSPPESMLQLNLPSSSSVIVITINNSPNPAKALLSLEPKAPTTDASSNENPGMVAHALEASPLPSLSGNPQKTLHARTLTPFQRELVSELRGFRKEDLKSQEYGLQWD